MKASESFFFSLIISATIITNVIEIVILIRKRKKLTNYEWLLLSLSVSDLFVGLSKGVIALLMKFDVISDTSSKDLAPLWFSVACSISHTLGITLDRLSAVAYPIRHKILSTGKNISLMLICAWSFGLVVFPVNSTSSHEQIKFYLALLIIITSTAILISYSFIIYKVLIKRRRLFSKTSGYPPAQAANITREFSIVAICFAISLTFAAMMLPFATSAINYDDPQIFAKFLLISNSTTNPLLYFFWKYINEKVKARKLTAPKSKDSRNPTSSENIHIEAK